MGTGSMVEITDFQEANERAQKLCEEKGEEFVPAEGSTVLLGITKASLATESWMSAASFERRGRAPAVCPISSATPISSSIAS